MTGLVIEGCAGPGGWSTGLRWADYTGRALGIELDPDACATVREAGHERVQADVAAFDLEPYIGQVVGCILSPPCPTFSTAGDGAGKLDLPNVLRLIADFAAGREPGDYQWVDERSRLTAEPMRYVKTLMPRWVALEQVPPVLPIWQYLAGRLRGLGYRVWTGILSAEEYGVPQTRKRAILVASLDGPVGPPAPTHQAYVAGRDLQAEPDLFGDPLPPPVSMAEALGWGDTVATVRTSFGEPKDDPRNGHHVIDPAESPAHTVTGKVRSWTLRHDAQGNATTRAADEPAATILCSRPGNLRWMAPAGAAPTMVDPRPDHDPAHTITGKGTAAWVQDRPSTTVCGDARIGRPGHKDRDQGEAQFAQDSVRVTVQEAGILQSFPADYPWQGTKTAQYRQAGDAVPPLLAAAILRPLLATAAEVAA